MLPRATLGKKIAKVKAARSGHVQEDCEKVKAAMSDHVRSLQRGAREVCEKEKAARSDPMQGACEGVCEKAEKRRKPPQAIRCKRPEKGYVTPTANSLGRQARLRLRLCYSTQPATVLIPLWCLVEEP